MPHKINPINFENSEGNLLLANTLLNFMSEKLPVSRLQRDLTDSTITRNIGTIFGHMLVAYQNFKSGFNKLDVDSVLINEDLHYNCVVIIEGIQVILRKHGISNSYELCKDLTRNNEIVTMRQIRKFIKNLNVEEHIKNELYAINVENYTGKHTF
jgi:adenylosuccinate lyase